MGQPFLTYWRPLNSENLPPERQEVLLFWPAPETAGIFRIGAMMWKPFGDENPCFKLEVDYGDAGSWVYTSKDDEQPTHWMGLTAPQGGAS